MHMDLSARECDVVARESGVAEREARLKDQEAEFDDRNAGTRNLLVEVEERENQLRQKESDARVMADDVESRMKDVAVREDAVVVRENEVEALHAYALSLEEEAGQDDIAALKAKIEDLTDLLEMARDDVASSHAAATVQSSRVAILEAQLAGAPCPTEDDTKVGQAVACT